MKYIERTDYLDQLEEQLGTRDIKLITGMRGTGKTELLLAFIRRLREKRADVNIIFADLSDPAYASLKKHRRLRAFAEAHYKEGMANLFLVDEVRECSHFELAANGLQAGGKFDIYLVSPSLPAPEGEIAGLFPGGFAHIPVYPFSFREFCLYFSEEGDKHHLLEEYLQMGGLAGSWAYPSGHDRMEYLQDIFLRIVRRDLAELYRLSDTSVLEQLAAYLAREISLRTSPNRISENLNRSAAPANHVTTGKYIKHLISACLLHSVGRYDIRARHSLNTSQKYYLADTGLRTAVAGYREEDRGRLLENVIAAELLRRGCSLSIGKYYRDEVDFIAEKGIRRVYIQAAENISDEGSFRKEISPLLRIRDAYPKILLADTGKPEYVYEGVRVIDTADWLAGEGL